MRSRCGDETAGPIPAVRSGSTEQAGGKRSPFRGGFHTLIGAFSRLSPDRWPPPYPGLISQDLASRPTTYTTWHQNCTIGQGRDSSSLLIIISPRRCSLISYLRYGTRRREFYLPQWRRAMSCCGPRSRARCRKRLRAQEVPLSPSVIGRSPPKSPRVEMPTYQWI